MQKKAWVRLVVVAAGVRATEKRADVHENGVWKGAQRSSSKGRRVSRAIRGVSGVGREEPPSVAISSPPYFLHSSPRPQVRKVLIGQGCPTIFCARQTIKAQ